jgi:hypothetical protein
MSSLPSQEVGRAVRSRRWNAALAALVVLLAARLAPAQEREEWNLQCMGKDRIGYSRDQVSSVRRDGRALTRTVHEEHVVFNRAGQSTRLDATVSVLEDESGQVVEEHLESDQSAQRTVQHLEVKGDRATITKRTIGAPDVRTIDWKKEYLGPEARRVWTRTKIAAGEKKLRFADFDPELDAVTHELAVVGKEKVALTDRDERELMHLRMTTVEVPTLIVDEWVDDSFVTWKSVLNIGFEITSLRSTREECVAALAHPDAPEMFSHLSPISNVRLPDPYRLDEVVLRLRKSRPGDVVPALEDERQSVVERRSDQDVVLRVRRVVPKTAFTLPLTNLTDGEKHCLERNTWIQSDDPAIVKLAKETVGDEKDAWKAACRLEQFVNRYVVDKNYSTAFASASEVCRDRKGDCTEHGVLLAALCRAAGIPARVAVGLLYFGGGAWGGHLWTEVSLGGQWYAIDSVLGRGGVDAAHLRLAADALFDVGLEREFAKVASGLTLQIDVLSFRHGDHEVKLDDPPKVCSVVGARFRHLLYGVELTAPDGWHVVPNQKVDLNDEEVAELEHAGVPPMRVEVKDVPLDFTVEQLGESLKASGVSRLAATDRTIAGRAGKVFRGRKDDRPFLAAAVLRDQTLVVVEAAGDSEAAFDAVVASLALDG